MDYTQLIEQFPEINPANYNDDDVNALNAWGIAAHDAIEALQAEVSRVKEVEFPQKLDAVVAGWKLKCEALQARVKELESEASRRQANGAELIGLRAKLAALEGQLPIGHLDGTDISAEFMSVELRAEHVARDSHTPKLFTVPVYLAAGAQPSTAAPTALALMTEYSNGKQWALEEAARVADDSDHIVEGRGYYDQLGDANATQRNIVEAIRKIGGSV